LKVHYDEEVDVLYLKLGDQKPDGVIEIAEGINIDTTTDGKLTGIEILKASQKINIDTILSYTLELDQGILRKKSPNNEVTLTANSVAVFQSTHPA